MVVYFTLSFIIGIALLVFTFTSSHISRGQKMTSSIANQILMAAFVLVMFGLSMSLTYFAPAFLCLLVCRLTFVFFAWFCTGFCGSLLTYMSTKKHAVVTVVQSILNVAALAMVFISGKVITGVSLDENHVYHVVSANLVDGSFGRMLNLAWLDAYVVFYLGVLELGTVLMVLVRAESSKNKILKQNLSLISLGVLLSWGLYVLLMAGSLYQPAFRHLCIWAIVPELLVYVYGGSNTSVFGKNLVGRTILRILVVYIVPALILGASFFLLFKLFPEKGVAFTVFAFLITAIVFGVWVLVANRLSKMDAMRDGDYAEDFEEKITSIEFDKLEKANDIVGIVTNAFKKYVQSSSVRIAIDAGTGFLETVDEDEENKIMVPIDQDGFDILLNIKHSVVFREFVEKDYAVKPVSTDLLAMMDENNADAFILLNEGRRIVGAIFLGPKTSGDIYNEYDYNIFTKLYSNFFVVGYYMKNMMNESVVGTVNREIRMSSQIITSIQENMDYISNPKLDCGYLMVPAHNIGGEFIDMIRLNDTRHMFVIGALSGKGIAASMSMVILKSVIRTDLAETKDFKMLVEKVNAFVRTGLPKGTFFAGLFGIMDFATDTLYYINCGIPALFMYNHLYNNVIEIQGEGHVLGFAKDISNLVRVKKVKLSAGDILFTCTDGLIESKSLRGESYGKTRVQSQIMENSAFTSRKMAQFAHDNLLSFTSRALEDDVTVFVIKQLGQDAEKKQ